MERFKTIVALLAWASLLVGSMMPPVVQHAHAHGDKPHQHGHSHRPAQGCTVAAHGGCHGHSHSHSHNTPASDRLDGVGVAPHLHITFLWFHVWVPVPESGDSEKDRFGWDQDAVTLVALLDHDALGTVAAAKPVPPACTSGRSAPMVAASLPRLCSDACPDLASLPLCDTARHARSGVQLI